VAFRSVAAVIVTVIRWQNSSVDLFMPHVCEYKREEKLVEQIRRVLEKNEEKILIATKINKQLKKCIHFKDVININWHCVTRRKVAGSIPDGVNGIFHGRNPSGRTMVLGLTQSLREMSTRNISWGVKAAGA